MRVGRPWVQVPHRQCNIGELLSENTCTCNRDCGTQPRTGSSIITSNNIHAIHYDNKGT